MRYRKPRVLLLGDLMVDEWVYVQPRFYNPEGAANACIGSAKDRGCSLGGAGIVAVILRRLGASLKFMTQLSGNAYGMFAHSLLHQERISCRYATFADDWDMPVKRRYVNSAGVVVFRYDEETPAEQTAELAGNFFDADVFETLAAKADVIVIADYDKGYLTGCGQQIIQIASEHEKIVVVGAKPNRLRDYVGADVVKINAQEAASFLDVDPADVDENPTKFAESLCHSLQTRAAVITLGSRGAACAVRRTSNITALFEIAAKACFPAVKNCVGAGDAFLAGFALDYAVAGNYAGRAPLLYDANGSVTAAMAVTAAYLENGVDGVGAFVPVLARHEALCRERIFAKVMPLDAVDKLCQAWRQSDERIVFTNGCFDLLHEGHLHLLQQAKQQGTKLVVAVNSDDSVRLLKGAARPAQSFSTRSKILAALTEVDAVILLDEEDFAGHTALRSMISMLHPDVLVKGAEYAESDIVGWEEILNRADPGVVWRCPMLRDCSTTHTIEKLRNPHHEQF